MQFLDSIYQKHLEHYNFERVNVMKRQLQGIDLVLRCRGTQCTYFMQSHFCKQGQAYFVFGELEHYPKKLGETSKYL